MAYIFCCLKHLKLRDLKKPQKPLKNREKIACKKTAVTLRIKRKLQPPHDTEILR